MNKLLVALAISGFLVGCGAGAGGSGNSGSASSTPVTGQPLTSTPPTVPAESPPVVAPVSPPVVPLVPPQATTTRVMVSWSAPTTRQDGSPLAISAISGYEIYFTNDAGTVNRTVPVSGGAVLTDTISDVDMGANYYFTIVAIDTDGLKSSLSNMVTVSL